VIDCSGFIEFVILPLFIRFGLFTYCGCFATGVGFLQLASRVRGVGLLDLGKSGVGMAAVAFQFDFDHVSTASGADPPLAISIFRWRRLREGKGF